MSRNDSFAAMVYAAGAIQQGFYDGFNAEPDPVLTHLCENVLSYVKNDIASTTELWKSLNKEELEMMKLVDNRKVVKTVKKEDLKLGQPFEFKGAVYINTEVINENTFERGRLVMANLYNCITLGGNHFFVDACEDVIPLKGILSIESVEVL